MLVEDVVWRGANEALRALRQLSTVRWVGAQLGRLPGWAALPMFLVPEAIGRLGELAAVVRMADGHVRQAAGIYVVVRLLATLLAVFVFQSCEVALNQIGWFAAVLRQVRTVRGWALALIAPFRERLSILGRRGPRIIGRRISAQRRLVLKHWRKLTVRSGG